MPNYNPKDIPDSIKDKDTPLGADAQNAQDRFKALEWCLANNWDGADIGRLERSDTATFHGWQMWPYVNS
jgi:hypothetical protein